METVAGVFRTCESAAKAAADVMARGVPRDQVNLLSPCSPAEHEAHALRTSDTEQPGVGAAIGGAVGAAVGMAGGFELGIGATMLVPGVGPILAVGIAAGALLGAGGLFAGAALGGKADEKSTEGIPADELFFYEDALRQGKSVVIVLAQDHVEKRHAQEVMEMDGAESLDAARHDWWVGLRDVEAEHYRALGRNFNEDQEAYRGGFEAALRRDLRGKPLDDAADRLKWLYPDMWDSPAFRAGYNRGRVYWDTRAPVGTAGR